MTSAQRNQLWFWIVAAALAVFILLLVARWRERALEDAQFASYLTGDATRGAWLYETKGCAGCHPLDGAPPANTPDLRLVPEEHASFNALVSAMWNHAPAMWRRIQQTHTNYPYLADEEVADLFAFLYVVRYVYEPGSAERGRLLFANKGCAECHAVDSRGQAEGCGGKPSKCEGPDLTRAENGDVPILWIQRMWNHALSMRERMERRELPWPRFDESEMSDLLSYVRSINTGPRSPGDLFPADARRGRRLFRAKGCAECHAVKGEGASIGPDLAQLPRMPRTLGQMAGVMWNHWPQMADWLQQRKVEVPHFEGREMADLIAYLYALRYFDEPGVAEAGRRVYAGKGCNNCHGPDGRGGRGGPDLRGRRGTYSAVSLAGAMWRHGPQMYAEMERRKVAWPRFEKREMNDLVVYLNSW